MTPEEIIDLLQENGLRISELDDGVSPQDSDIFVVARGATNRRLSHEQLAIVSYNEQDLTVEQQMQARDNIGAAALRPAQVAIAGTTHTFDLTDEGAIVVSQSGSATTFTIALDSTTDFPVGAIIGQEQHGTGTLTITGVAGVTLNGTDGGSVTLSAQWGASAIRKTAANAWIAVGGLA